MYKCSKEGRELKYNDDKVFIGGKIFTLNEGGYKYECFFKGFVQQNICISIKSHDADWQEQELYVQGHIKFQVGKCIIEVKMVALEPNHCWIRTEGQIMQILG